MTAVLLSSQLASGDRTTRINAQQGSRAAT